MTEEKLREAAQKRANMYPLIIRAYNYRNPTKCSDCGVVVEPKHLHATLYSLSPHGRLTTRPLCVRCAWGYRQRGDVATDLFASNVLAQILYKQAKER